MIKNRSIARIIVKVENLEKAVTFCEKVLGAEFFFKDDRSKGSSNGLLCAMSTNPGLELMEIISDRGDISMFQPHPNGSRMFDFFRDHAPGVVGVVFDMDGVEEAKSIAAEMGICSQFEYIFSTEELNMLGWNYSRYTEYFLEPEKTAHTIVLLSDFNVKE